MKTSKLPFRFLGFLAPLSLLVALLFPLLLSAQTPAPALVAPSSGASLVQPIALDWSPVVDPNASIGIYTWQGGTSSSFGTVVAEGSQNLADESIPLPTEGKLSGLPNGTYFWRVRAFGSVQSPWSAVRSFTVTGLGPAPGTPVI